MISVVKTPDLPQNCISQIDRGSIAFFGGGGGGGGGGLVQLLKL